MSATERKVRSDEDHSSCLLGGKSCQSVDQATKLFKLHNQIQGILSIDYSYRNAIKLSLKESKVFLNNFITISDSKLL